MPKYHIEVKRAEKNVRLVVRGGEGLNIAIDLKPEYARKLAQEVVKLSRAIDDEMYAEMLADYERVRKPLEADKI